MKLKQLDDGSGDWISDDQKLAVIEHENQVHVYYFGGAMANIALAAQSAQDARTIRDSLAMIFNLACGSPAEAPQPSPAMPTPPKAQKARKSNPSATKSHSKP